MTKSSSSAVVHLKLHTGDLPGARALCATLCGWRSERIETASGSYPALEPGPRLGGGIIEYGTDCARWLPYVGVSQIEAATDLASRRGASILLEPREGQAGWRSVISTREAEEIALWQRKGWRL